VRAWVLECRLPLFPDWPNILVVEVQGCIAGDGGEARSSPETGTMRLAAVSSAKVRKKS
jgi:hypothetical protein